MPPKATGASWVPQGSKGRVPLSSRMAAAAELYDTDVYNLVPVMARLSGRITLVRSKKASDGHLAGAETKGVCYHVWRSERKCASASARTTVLDPSVSMSAVGHSTVKSPQLKMRIMTCGGLCVAPHGHCM